MEASRRLCYICGMDANPLQNEVDEIRKLIEQRLGYRASSFERQLRKARRYFPRAVRADADFLSEAEKLARNPKLRPMINGARASKAYASVSGFLKTVDKRQRRKELLIDYLAAMAFYLLLIGSGVLALMVARGLI